MAVDFTDLDQAKTVALGRFPDVDEDELEALLIASACVEEDGVTPFYRPYLVVANLLRSRWQQYKRVKSAAGSEVEWADPNAAYRALTDLQRSIATGKTCPDGWAGNATFEAVV